MCSLLALFAASHAFAQGPEAGNEEVEIEAQYFGVGNTIRAGDWAGVRVILRDLSDEPRDVAVRLHMTDPDGDTALLQRVITLTPGRDLATWMYAKMPWSIGPSQALMLTVHEADVSGAEPVVMRQIGYERISPQRVVSPSQSLLGVVGRETFGLLQYEERGRAQEDESIVSHERTRIVHGISHDRAELPTEWMGLMPFETIVWTEGDPNLFPQLAMAQALREWVLRGGHLVIVMEPVGDGWFTANNPLRDILPDVTPIRHEEVDLEPYRYLLTRPKPEFDRMDMPGDSVVHSFSVNDSADRGDAIPVVNGPQGTVITRRLVGTGMVTVVGLDLSAGAIDRRGLIRADAFWNRVLGKRTDTPTGAELDAISSGGVLGALRNLNTFFADRFISEEINLTGTVSVGVLFGLGLFSVYWLVSGFGSFAGLRSRGLERHAWIVFVLVIGLFTVIAWAGARMLKPTDVSTLHVTFLDHVYGRTLERARSFSSVMLPEYGTQRVAITPQSQEQPWRQALTPWADPSDAGTQRSFPDARPYVIPTSRPDGMSVPARQTVKQFRADWLGAPVWTMPIPQGEGAFPRVSRSGELTGVLAHDLPAALEEVVIFHVRGQRSIEDVHEKWANGETGVLMFETDAVRLPDPWSPGTPLDLGAVFAQVDPDSDEGARYLARIVPMSRTGVQGVGTSGGEKGDYSLVNFHDVLAQPQYEREDFAGRRRMLVRRRMTHTLGMGKWFTSPCVIITGQLEGRAMPVPMEINGREIDSVGRTIVRWVYPLDGQPLTVR